MKLQASIINEHDNEIFFEVAVDRRGVTLVVEGPTSKVEHTWTRMEAEVIQVMFKTAERLYSQG